jgi:hypothetical protein
MLFEIDSITPNLNLTSPANNTNSTDNILFINYTASDDNLDSCWYSNDTYSANTTLADCTTNVTLTWPEGIHNLTVWTNDSFGNENSSYILFTIDTSYPIVSLVSPANASTWTSSSTITFSYNVSDVNIVNCSLIIGGVVDQTNTTISENISQSFSKSLSNAAYVWNVSCIDTVGYTNSSGNRSLTVSYTAPVDNGGSSGGSSGSSTPAVVTPKEFDVDFSKTATESVEAKQGEVKTLTFNNQVTHKITVSELTTSSIKLIIESEPIILILNVGETKPVDMNADSINDFEIKLISIVNLNAKFSITKLSGADIVAQEEIEELVRKEALFDVKVEVLDKFKEVFAGEEVSAQIEAFNINNIGQVDVVVDYYLSDNETVFGEGASDTLAVEAVASFVRSLLIPKDMKPGIYYFNANVTYKDVVTSGRAEFRVNSDTRGFFQKWFREIVIAIIVIVGVGLFLYLRMIKGKEEKLERIVKKLKRSKK